MRRRAAFSAIIATVINLTTGITISLNSNVILDLAREDSIHRLTILQQSVFAALVSVGAVVGSLVGGWMSDHSGRKCTLLFSGAPLLVGYLLFSYAHFSSVTETFVWILYTGRFCTGLALGSTTGVVGVYITEVSPPELRGILGTLNEGAVVAGITLTYALGSINGVLYYHISLVAVGIVALFEVLMIWLPETPRSLLSRGYVKETERVLTWLRGPNTTKELEEIKANVIATRRAARGQTWRLFFRKAVLIPFLYVILVFLVKQFCGINVILSYIGEIFVEAGVPNPRATAIYTVGASSLAGIMVAFFTVDIVGRKPLLAISGALMMVGATALGIHFYITRPSLCGLGPPTSQLNSLQEKLASEGQSHFCNANFAPIAIVSVIVYTFGFNVGFGPLPWVLMSELLPLSVRGKATGLCLVVSFISSTIVVGTYLELAELVNHWLVLWGYALVSMAGSLFVLFFIPETMRKSLEAVESGFKKRLAAINLDL